MPAAGGGRSSIDLTLTDSSIGGVSLKWVMPSSSTQLYTGPALLLEIAVNRTSNTGMCCSICMFIMPLFIRPWITARVPPWHIPGHSVSLRQECPQVSDNNIFYSARVPPPSVCRLLSPGVGCKTSSINSKLNHAARRGFAMFPSPVWVVVVLKPLPVMADTNSTVQPG